MRAFRRKSPPVRSRANGQHGGRAPLRKNFRDWILRYVRNAAASKRSAKRSLDRPATLDLAPVLAVAPTTCCRREPGAGEAMSGSRSPCSEAGPVARGVLDAWDIKQKISTERTIATSKSAFFWSFKFSERCHGPRPMSSSKQDSEKARMRVQPRRAADARDPRPQHERVYRRQCRAQIWQGGSAAPE